MTRFFFTLSLLLSLLGTALFASDKDIREVSELFMKRADLIMQIVPNKILSKEERNDKIIEAVTPMFDFRLMAKLSLGKHVWRSLTPEKQRTFTDLYVERMKNSYSKKVDIYTDEKILIESAQQDRPDRITLVTQLKGSTENTEVIYKFYKPRQSIQGKDTWLIYDAVIIGVSIIKTDRSQFREVLAAGTIDTLMQKMQDSKE